MESLRRRDGYSSALEERIRKEAYQVYLSRQRTGRSGDEKSDWFQAETRVRNHAYYERNHAYYEQHEVSAGGRYY
jgi:hypothetical protein